MSWLSERLSETRARMAPIRAWAAPRIAQGRHWLIAPREPLTWPKLPAFAPQPRSWLGRIALVVVALSVLAAAVFAGLQLINWCRAVVDWYRVKEPGKDGAATYPNASLANPILGGLGALFLIYAAIRQARTASAQAEIARKQAQIASDRHEAQTKADAQRRITETFSTAVEQLGSDKMEVRVGGVYTLERLAREALAGPVEERSGRYLYWTVMETLTAFVRARARWQAPRAAAGGMADKSDYLWPPDTRPVTRSDEAQPRPELATDIAAVLEVIRRRPSAGLKREMDNVSSFAFGEWRDTDPRGSLWRLDLCGTDLRGASLAAAHLRHALLVGTQLVGANLRGAKLVGAQLERANLSLTHLDGADLSLARLEGADLREAHLEGADLRKAHLDGVLNLDQAYGDTKTLLPDGVARPAHWG